MIAAVVFDLDGVLVDSEQVWDEARRQVVAEHCGRWREDATTDMLGMSSREWPRYLRDELGVELEPQAISDAVVARVDEHYRRELPLLPGAVEAVRRIGERWPLGLATSSNREIVDLFLELAGLAGDFAVTLHRGGRRGGGQAGPGRLPRGLSAPRCRADACGCGRGLACRHRLGARGRDARDRDPEPLLPTRRRSARRGRRRAGVVGAAHARGCGRLVAKCWCLTPALTVEPNPQCWCQTQAFRA